MTTVNSNHAGHGFITTVKRLPRTADNRRKVVMPNPPNLEEDWPPRDEHLDRYTDSNTYRQDYDSERIQCPEGRTSQESVTNEEEENSDYVDDFFRLKPGPRKNNEIPHRKYPPADDYVQCNVPEPIMAIQKLQKLRELQRRRDISEKYYSQEIRRLISGQYFGPRITLPTLKINEKLQNSYFRPYAGDRARNSHLESCGTMTTITRLDCGCIQETTRPIFTTARGHVLKKSCSQSQDELFIKFASINPREHMFSMIKSQKNQLGCDKSKKQISLNPRIQSTSPLVGNRDLEIGMNQRKDMQHLKIKGNPRKGSPVRKFSDETTASV